MRTIDLDLVYGVFLQEEKNRFICKVAVRDQVFECYVPSSCRLSNFTDLRNRTVALRLNGSKRTRTQYALYAIQYGSRYVLVDQTQPNRIIESSIGGRRFSFLGPRKTIQREKTIEGYKSDLFIPDTNTIIEIKSILAFEKCAFFPAVYPQRGIEQLKKLLSLLNKGYRVHYFLVAMNPRIVEIRFSGKYKEFDGLFQQCLDAGMVCHGFSVKLINGRPTIHSRISVVVD